VDLSLNEVVEPPTFTTAGNTGRLLTLLGNRAFPALLPFGAGGTYYEQPPTETVTYNTIRIWRIFNFTADAHPMHFHLFNVQILSRQKANRNFGVVGRAVPPLPNEDGLKETVTVYPGEVLTLAALVEDPMPPALYPRAIDPVTGLSRPTVAVTVSGFPAPTSYLPVSPRTGNDEYVWHCHILEHEEHDMMRPLIASGP
jgi:spore coat protein A